MNVKFLCLIDKNADLPGSPLGCAKLEDAVSTLRPQAPSGVLRKLVKWVRFKIKKRKFIDIFLSNTLNYFINFGKIPVPVY